MAGRRPGGGWPGGLWFGIEIDVQYETHEIYLHDVVGWRRDHRPSAAIVALAGPRASRWVWRPL